MSATAQEHNAGHAPEHTKRDFLKLVAASGAAIGVGAIAWPLIDSLNPSSDVLALSSAEYDIASIPAGQGITVVWRGKPVFVRHRTPEEVKTAEGVKLADLMDPASDESRQGGAFAVARRGRHLHPSGLHPIGQQNHRRTRRFRRLFLPLPRQPV